MKTRVTVAKRVGRCWSVNSGRVSCVSDQNTKSGISSMRARTKTKRPQTSGEGKGIDSSLFSDEKDEVLLFCAEV